MNERPGRERPVIRLFGPLTIEVESRVLGPRDLGGTRPKRVLEILLAARGHRVPTDRLAELLWGEELPQNASGSIQTFVSVLRRVLVSDRDWARELVVTEAEAYRFDADLVDLDLDRFDALVERARREPTGRARRLLEEAVKLVRGEVLEDEPYAVWAHDLRTSYQGRVLGAYLDAANGALAELDYSAAVAHAETAVRLDPFSERAHRTGMLALYALGQQHEALDTYRRLRTRLDDDLGLEPTAETRALESAILRQEDLGSLLPHPAEPARHASARSSVKLLGRKTELQALERSARQALAGSLSLMLVEGEAGVGKTRLLDELANTLAGIRFGRGRGSQLEQHLPYVPLAEALRGALGPIDPDNRLRPALARILPELSLEDAGPPSAHLDALEALAELLAQHAPLVLFIDDLQWADPASIAAISYLQRRCAHLPLVLVAAARGEQTLPDHSVRRLQPDTVVRLEPLTRAELASLGMPDLYERTGGHPRFVTEALANGRDGTRSSRVADEVLAQCRAEGVWPYRVLLAAAVLGRSFDPEPLAALLEVDTVELIEELERLCDRRILAVDGPGFGFRYDLVRDVLVSSLSPARRRLLEERMHRAEIELEDSSTPHAPGSGKRRAGVKDDGTLGRQGPTRRRGVVVAAAQGV